MTTIDCSTNRFTSLEETQQKNPFMNKSQTKKTFENVSGRWSNLKAEEDEDTNRSPKNTFKKRSNFGPNKDRYGNYRKPMFRRETRPKTPPPPEFDFKEDDFPVLG